VNIHGPTFRLSLLALVLFGVAFSAMDSVKGLVLNKPKSALGTLATCQAYKGLPLGWGKAKHAGMVKIEGGEFQVGSERGYPDERPLPSTQIDSFWIDRTEVSNAQFAAFVAATHYVTDAEKNDGSAVFRMPGVADGEVKEGSWWHLIKDANWQHPEGAGSDIVGREHEPVVNVSYTDALAYAHWLGRELPTEAQWEYAAKGGRSNEKSDRSLRDAKGHPLANFWQGLFPISNSDEDGFPGRAPVGCFAANPYGLHDMVGNVWEWTTDIYSDRSDMSMNMDDQRTAIPARGTAPLRVIKGGSYLCSADYCVRARASSRQPEESDLPASHLGFRTISKS
jgi:formylglycine-generating enzyme required for sulfatase activity